jgi:glycosyltransferase involved in cell wall biosynthesis
VGLACIGGRAIISDRRTKLRRVDDVDAPPGDAPSAHGLLYDPDDARELEFQHFKPRSILFVSWRDLANPMAGGSELLIHELADGLARKGYDVSLLCGGPVEAKENYRISNSGSEFSQYLIAPVRHRQSFRHTDLVVDVCNGMPFMTPLWNRRANLCLVNHVHTEQWSGRFNPVVAAVGRTFESRIMPFVHRKNLVVTISPSTHASLARIGFPEERIRQIPQGVGEPPDAYEKSPTPLFLAVGRLVGYKRIDLLLQMWKSVRPTLGGKLVIIGDGPDRAALEALNTPDVEFTGFIPETEKHRLMSQAWVLVHPASWEGWGLVITEAAVRGTPAVGFDVAGVRDAIINVETGLLASDRAAFEKHWIALAQDSVLRDELATGGIKRCLSMSWALTVDRFEQVAAEAVARHHGVTA